MESLETQQNPVSQNNQVKFTYEDYLLTPEGKFYELIDGELLMTPSPTFYHQNTSKILFRILDRFISENKLGEVLYAPMDVYLSDENVVQPDILFLAKSSLKKITPRCIKGAPDLVIEILSPGTETRDLVTKRKLYRKFGVKEYWIVDPDKKNIEVMTWQGSEFKTLVTYPEHAFFSSPLFQGLSFKISEVFGNL